MILNTAKICSVKIVSIAFFCSQIAISDAQESETKKVLGNAKCDCTIVPFKPSPPCFELCYVKYASQANASTLTEVLGLTEELAKKLTNLNELGVQVAPIAMASATFMDREIKLYTDAGFESYTTAGVYEDMGKLKIIAEKNRFDSSPYSAVSVPAELTSVSENGVLTAWALSEEIETPKNWGFNGPESFRPSTYWTDTLITTDELSIVRNAMENLSVESLRSLHD